MLRATKTTLAVITIFVTAFVLLVDSPTEATTIPLLMPPSIGADSVGVDSMMTSAYRSPLISLSGLPPITSPDVPIIDSPDVTQSEPSVFVFAEDPRLVLVSNYSTPNPMYTGGFYGADFYVSKDRGATWAGSFEGVGGAQNMGGGSCIMRADGTIMVGFTDMNMGQSFAASSDTGATWQAYVVAPPPEGGLLVEGRLARDSNPASLYYDWAWYAWTRTAPFDPLTGQIQLKYSQSVNGGWQDPSTGSVISAGAGTSPDFHQGVTVHSGPIGQGGAFGVIAVWAILQANRRYSPEENLFGLDEINLGFAKSLDGGVTWGEAARIFSSDIRGIQSTGIAVNETTKRMRVNSSPSAAVDQRYGSIYVVWANIGEPGVNEGDVDIYMVKSADGGESWGTPTRVNQDQIDNGKDQWFPWIACDPVTGLLAVVYYDSREFAANDSVLTYVSISNDGGASWQDARLSEAAWAGNPIGGEGLDPSYAGDYIGVDVAGNTVYPVWSDSRSGHMLAYTSPFHLPRRWEVPGDAVRPDVAMLLASEGDTVGVGLPLSGPSWLGPLVVTDGVLVEAQSGVRPTIDGGAYARAVEFPSEADAKTTLRGFTLQGGTDEVVLLKGSGRLQDCVVDASLDDTGKGVRGFDTFLGCEITDCVIRVDNGCGLWSQDLNGTVERDSIVVTGDGQGMMLSGGGAAISACVISGVGTVGAEFAGAYGSFEDCTVAMEHGVGIWLGSEVEVANCDVSMTGGNTNDYGVVIDGQGAVLRDCVVSAPGTPGGTGIDVRTEALVERCTVHDVGYGVINEGGTVRGCIVSEYNIEGFSDDAVTYCIADGEAGFGTGTQGTGSVNEDPLHCDPSGSEYTLRVDSYGNPENNDYGQIGAFPVVCMYGTLVRDATFAGEGVLDMPGDVTIPSSRSLTLGAGTTVNVASTDNQQGGSNSWRSELIVLGTVEINGSAVDTVKFQSAEAEPAEGVWDGLHVQNGGTATIKYALVRDAVYGLKVATHEPSSVTYSRFSNNQSYDILAVPSTTGSFPFRVAHNTITVAGGTGIEFTSYVDGAVVDTNAVIGNGISYAGIELGTGTTGQGVALKGNSISGFTNGAGVLETFGAALTMVQNSVSYSKWGVKVVRGSPVIGTAADSDNYLTNNVSGVYAEGIYATPVIRNNYISSNTYGVQAKTSAVPDMGTGTYDRGNNYLDGNSTYCIWNRTTGGTSLPAQYNYFGECDQGVPPFCAYGNVDVSGVVCTPPATAAKVSMVETLAPARGFQIAGVVPNPMLAGGDIQLSLAQGRTVARVEIFDVTGRLVRTFGDSEVSQGRSLVHWDGRNNYGVPVNSGIYFVRARSSEGQQGSARILVAH